MDAGVWSPAPQDSAGFGAFIISFPLFWFDDNGLKFQAIHRPAGLSPPAALHIPSSAAHPPRPPWLFLRPMLVRASKPNWYTPSLWHLCQTPSSRTPLPSETFSPEFFQTLLGTYIFCAGIKKYIYTCVYMCMYIRVCVCVCVCVN